MITVPIWLLVVLAAYCVGTIGFAVVFAFVPEEPKIEEDDSWT
jgi:hypothetical protein